MTTLIGGTNQGLVRVNNQDRFEIVRLSAELAFAVLCDGMGGENGGQVASELAVSHVSDALRRGLAEGMSETTLRSVLLSAVSTANALVFEAAQKDESLAGMGTTIIVAVFQQNTLSLACVGDSRAYRVTPSGAQQISRDHTVVQMLVDIGEITEEDAATHPKRHFITRAVGVGTSIDADFIVQPLEEGDIVLLCSDGLYNYLEPGGIYPLLEECLRGGAVQPLIDLANEAGGADNITAIVAK